MTIKTPTLSTISAVLFSHSINALSTTPIIESKRALLSRSRLTEALRSPSKKLTLLPELVLPEPTDPTALLLRASEVTKLSQVLRTKARANALFVEGTVDALRPMGKEQEGSRGNFPGPVPIVHSWTAANNEGSNGGLADFLEELQRVECVEGVLLPFCNGKEINSVESYVEEIKSCVSLTEDCSQIWNAGLQPIPELTLAYGSEWSEENVIRLVDAVKETCGGLDPVSIVFSNGKVDENEQPLNENEETGDDDEEEYVDSSTPTITIPKTLSSRLTFLSSIRTAPGEGRMNLAISTLSSKNFHGAFLRADCVPGFRLNPDLNVVGNFWSAVLGDLKSLKSKNFSFRSKVKLSKDVPMEWFNYQKDVMESGALGSPGGGGGSGSGFDPDSGDYKGF